MQGSSRIAVNSANTERTVVKLIKCLRKSKVLYKGKVVKDNSGADHHTLMSGFDVGDRMYGV